MNWGLLLLVLGVGLAAALFVALWPYLNPESPLWAQQRLAEVVRTWEQVRDLEAHLLILRPGEPRLAARLLYLSGAAVRLEIEEPPELAGEVYTLRPVEGGWLLVHFRPALALGLERRVAPQELQALWPLAPGGRAEVRWIQDAAFVLRPAQGPFAEVEVHLEGELRLPTRVLLRAAEGGSVEVRATVRGINRGLELRELLSLDPFPTRWIRIPALPAPGA
ncbi:MAG: hypothetical protein ABDI20_08545 [Candidatus Bipolaricaulaceae bacterium]